MKTSLLNKEYANYFNELVIFRKVVKKSDNAAICLNFKGMKSNYPL